MRSVSGPFLALLVVATAVTTTKGIVEIVYPPYLVGYGYSLTIVGMLLSLFAVVQLASRVPIGLAYRPERAARQFAASLVAFGLSASAFALADGHPVAVVALSLVHGFAFGSAGTLGLALAIDVTEGRRAGVSMAWYTAAISIGYALGSVIGGALGESIGFSATMGLSGLLPIAASLVILFLPAVKGAPLPPDREPGLRGLLRGAARLDGRVWLAFMTVLFMNLVWDSLDVFFVIFAPTVGISLAAVGALRALKSGASVFIRLTGAVLLRVVDHRRVTLVAVLAVAASMVAVPASSSMAVLIPVFTVLGLGRGILRATSAATIAELRNEGRDVGLASGVYNAGLDVGAIAGPILGGAIASAIGIPQMFQAVGLLGLAAWLAVALSGPRTRTAAGLYGLKVIPFRRRPVTAPMAPVTDPMEE
jgi:ACDE family multidrug resistance protein